MMKKIVYYEQKEHNGLRPSGSCKITNNETFTSIYVHWFWYAQWLIKNDNMIGSGKNVDKALLER
jgi:hypothetical protein